MNFNKKIYIIIAIFLSIMQLQAQNFSSFKIKKDTAFIGDPIYVQLKIIKSSTLQNIDLSALSQIRALNDTTQADVTIESYGDWKVDKNLHVAMNSVIWTANAEGKQEANTTIKMVFWDNGLYQLPQLRIQNSMPLQSPRITILAPQDIVNTAGDSTMAIMPIKSILKEHKNINDYLPYILALLGIGLLYALYYFYQKKKHQAVEEEIIAPIIPAHEIALASLNKLKDKELWQKGHIKAYQSELTHIIRAYLGERYGINALENTTDEVLRLLKQTDFNEKLQSQVSNILQMADMIKFAKATPTDDIHQAFWDQAKSLVEETKIIVEQSQEG